MYAVIQQITNSKSIILGLGETKWDAIDDASRWADKPVMDIDEYLGKGCPSDEYTPVIDKSNGGSMTDGALYIVRCSPELANAVYDDGGDIDFTIDAGYAYRPQDIEGY